MAGGGAATGSWNPFSLTTYQQYFDVDTADVVDRLRCRIIFLSHTHTHTHIHAHTHAHTYHKSTNARTRARVNKSCHARE